MLVKRFIYISALCAVATSGMAQTKQPLVWPKVKAETRPWTRWWWMGSAVDQKNIAAFGWCCHQPSLSLR